MKSPVQSHGIHANSFCFNVKCLSASSLLASSEVSPSAAKAPYISKSVADTFFRYKNQPCVPGVPASESVASSALPSSTATTAVPSDFVSE